MQLIRAYRVRGHLEADLDPLGLERGRDIPELDYRTYGFTEADLDREIFINNLFGRERVYQHQTQDKEAGFHAVHLRTNSRDVAAKKRKRRKAEFLAPSAPFCGHSCP